MLIRPRLSDFYGLTFTQEEVDFAIPFLGEDIPLYIDPFLLWKSPSQQDNSLHTALVEAFNQIGFRYTKGEQDYAIATLIKLSECDEIGFGNSKTRKGKPIGKKIAQEILQLFVNIPQIKSRGFSHFEEIQLCIGGISKDRISDITGNLLKSFLVDFTIEQSKKHHIPTSKVRINTYSFKKGIFIEEEVDLPINPESKEAVILVPKRWLKFIPWINFDDFFEDYFIKNIEDITRDSLVILNYNRDNYDIVESYIKIKERQQGDCKNDPLFKAIPVTSAGRKITEILKLPTGKEDGADKEYEVHVCQLLTSFMYPQLDFADTQVRSISGVHIRDLIFYNNKSDIFLNEIYNKYKCRQMVMELKNVQELKTEHVNQLNRYLKEQFGDFGILVTRNEPKKNVIQNTIDLWAGQRKCILIITDSDLKIMADLYKSKQRMPIDVLKRRYVDFTRLCPS